MYIQNCDPKDQNLVQDGANTTPVGTLYGN